MNFLLGPHHQVIIHAQHAPANPTHGVMELTELETVVLMGTVYDAFDFSRKVRSVAYIQLDGLTNVIESIWKKARDVIDQLSENIIDPRQKEEFINLRDASRTFAARVEDQANSKEKKYKMFGEFECDELMQTAIAVDTAVKGFAQGNITIRFELAKNSP
ncbi:MAG: hypothetical protein ACK5MA_04675 [Parachlamydiaceae bacterium]